MTVTNYIWDELSDNVRMEVDDTGTVTAEYMNEPGQFGQLISQRRNSTNSFYHFDAQGSTRQLTNDAQSVTASYTYSAFGEPVSSTGSTTNPFRYNGAVGYYSDEETGEVYVRQRKYSPGIGRWLSKDPGGYFNGMSLYRRYFIAAYIEPRGMFIRFQEEQTSEKENWQDLIDKAESCKDLWEIIVAVSDNVDVDLLDDLIDPPNILDGVTGAVTDKLDEFAEDGNPCKLWLRKTLSILKKANEGEECEKCVQIAISKEFKDCKSPKRGFEVYTLGNLEEQANKLAEMCKCVCNLKKPKVPKPCPNIGVIDASP